MFSSLSALLPLPGPHFCFPGREEAEKVRGWLVPSEIAVQITQGLGSLDRRRHGLDPESDLTGGRGLPWG